MTTQRDRQVRGGIRQPAVLAWLRLARVYQKIDTASARHFARVALDGRHRLSTGQFDVLAQIGAHEGINQQELAEALLVTKGNISQLLARLETAGLIVRRQDGRRNCLSLSERGRALYAEIVPTQEALVAALFAPLTSEEQQRLLELLRKLDRGLEE